MNVVPITPAGLGRIFGANRAAIRKAIADEIERLVSWLDAIDGDPDREAEEDAEHDGREPDEGEYRLIGSVGA